MRAVLAARKKTLSGLYLQPARNECSGPFLFRRCLFPILHFMSGLDVSTNTKFIIGIGSSDNAGPTVSDFDLDHVGAVHRSDDVHVGTTGFQNATNLAAQLGYLLVEVLFRRAVDQLSLLSPPRMVALAGLIRAR